MNKNVMRKSEGKKAPLGTGARFHALTSKLESQGKSEESAKKIAAYIGRRKYGAKRMAKWAAKERKGGNYVRHGNK